MKANINLMNSLTCSAAISQAGGKEIQYYKLSDELERLTKQHINRKKTIPIEIGTAIPGFLSFGKFMFRLEQTYQDKKTGQYSVYYNYSEHIPSNGQKKDN